MWSLTSPVLRLSFGLWWSLFAVICLRCPASFPLRPSPPCHPAYAAPGRGVRPCLPRESASTAAARPSLTTVPAASPPTFFLFKIFEYQEEEEEIISSEIPLDSSASLSQPRHSSFFLGKLFWIWEEGDWQTLSLCSLSLSLSLGVSPSWFRWNLIWIAAFGFGHSCTATVGKKKNQDWTLKAPNLIKSGARKAPLMKPSEILMR